MDTPPRLREPCPEIATHEGSPGHGAALCLQQGDGVAPIHPPRAPARSCPPVFPAEFTGRLKRLKGTKTQSRFQLEFSSQKSSWACTEGICRNSYCFVLGASSGDATLPFPGAPRVLRAGPHVPRTGGTTGAVLELGSGHCSMG